MQQEKLKRKLATILAADVAGYSQMMGRDEEHTLRMLREYRGVFESLTTKHGGRIFNTAGDAILAEFGSAVEAVRCAVSIQEEIANRNTAHDRENQMFFRVGINVGDVLIEGDDLFGDGVNIAARLEGIAAAGGVCISGSTFEQVKNKLSIGFEEAGPQKLKNIPEAVSAYRIVPGKVNVNSGRKSAIRSPLAAIALVGIVLILGAAVAYYLIRSHPGSAYPFDGRWQVVVDSREGCYDNKAKEYPILVSKGQINEPSHIVPKKGYVSSDGRFQIELIGKTGNVISSVDGIIKGKLGRGRMSGTSINCTGDVTIRRMN